MIDSRLGRRGQEFSDPSNMVEPGSQQGDMGDGTGSSARDMTNTSCDEFSPIPHSLTRGKSHSKCGELVTCTKQRLLAENSAPFPMLATTGSACVVKIYGDTGQVFGKSCRLRHLEMHFSMGRETCE